MGTSIDIYGDVLVSSAPGDDLEDIFDVGTVYVFRHNSESGQWNQDGDVLTAETPSIYDKIGHGDGSTRVYGNTIVAGMRYDDEMNTDAGSVQIFTYS